MKTARHLAKGSRDLYRDAAAAVAGFFLRCDICKGESHPTTEEMEGYFEHGWPECCGETMRLTAQKGGPQ